MSRCRYGTGIYRWWQQARWPVISARSKSRRTRCWLASVPISTRSQNSSSPLCSCLGQYIVSSPDIALLFPITVVIRHSFTGFHRISFNNTGPVVLHVDLRAVKAVFHDTDILARILADSSDTRDFLELFLWQAERGSRPTRRHLRDDPREDVGEDVGVSVV